MNKLARIEKLTRQDPKYQRMLGECVQLEKQLFKALETVSPEINDIVWDFIMLCESISARKLWLACMDDGSDAFPLDNLEEAE